MEQIVNSFNNMEQIEEFSILVKYNEMEQKNYSFSAGQYFDVKIECENLTEEEFTQRKEEYLSSLNSLFKESVDLNEKIINQLIRVNYVQR